jgi:diphthamide synthase (EF-2-diphthine--ammonia ligase)
MVEAGLGASICCLDKSRLPADWLGRSFDRALLSDIDSLNRAGKDIDPCGEQGEFHTLVHRLPAFCSVLDWSARGSAEHGHFLALQLEGIQRA